MDISDKVKKVFVLMLENRSFDHMLGFSGIPGLDGITINPEDSSKGTQFNSFRGKKYYATKGAPYKMPFDPGHEFPDTVEQLAGEGATYPSGGPYPQINNSGFVANYYKVVKKEQGLQDIMCCFSPDQIPVLTTLAKKYAVCDKWFSSLPGATWPNRFFAMACSSGNLDDSPSPRQMGTWEGVDGFEFEHGDIFKMVAAGQDDDGNDYNWRIYYDHVGAENHFSLPVSGALKGIHDANLHRLSEFLIDVKKPSYDYALTWLEPNYGKMISASPDYTGGTSQHPKDDVRHGEGLIKKVYEAIRNSPHWNESLLIITYDEHGGFYDHVIPPSTVNPGDRPLQSRVNSFGFNFTQLGVRVPAVIVSPYIPENTVDHIRYDHASIAATLRDIFDLVYRTERDHQANNFSHLLSLNSPRTDNVTLNIGLENVAMQSSYKGFIPEDNINEYLPIIGNIWGFIHIALKRDLEISPESEHDEIKARVKNLRTFKDVDTYFKSVEAKINSKRT